MCTHLVGPLLRDVLADTGPDLETGTPRGPPMADSVILDCNTPVHVIEVKKVIGHPRGRDRRESAEPAQLCWYAGQLGTGGTLINSHRLLLLPRGAAAPNREILRRPATQTDRETIRQHLVTP